MYKVHVQLDHYTPGASFTWEKTFNFPFVPHSGFKISDGPFTFHFEDGIYSPETEMFFLTCSIKLKERDLDKKFLNTLSRLLQENGWTWKGSYELQEAIEIIVEEVNKNEND